MNSVDKYFVVAILILISFLLGALLVGCQLVTVEVHQTAITDRGDNTNDKYSDDGKEIKNTTDSVKVPISGLQ